MASQVDSLRIVGAVASVVALVRVLMALANEVRDALAAFGVGRDQRPGFYEVWFWGLLAALAGGLLWGVIWKRSIGGDTGEPHGWWAVLWPLLSLLPLLVGVAFLNAKYRMTPWTEHAAYCLLWLVGATVGSMVFYDLPMGGTSGFRSLLRNFSKSGGLGMRNRSRGDGDRKADIQHRWWGCGSGEPSHRAVDAMT